MKPVTITYFSDVLCIWAYIAQLRVDAVKANFGETVRFENKFCSVFGDTDRKIRAAWRDRGEHHGFNAHLRHAADAFPEIRIDPSIWLTVRPASSTGPHVFAKAVQLAESGGDCAAGSAEKTVRALRRAFFEDGRNIADWDVQAEIGEQSGLDVSRIEELMRNGRAFAALASDYQDADAAKIPGSPSFILNEGRQKLYGNVGYRIIEANIEELLHEPNHDQCSWC